MKKILLVLKNEIISLVSRPSFLLALLGLPLAGALVFAGAGALNKNASATQTVSQIFTGQQDTRPEGYVDLSGIIRQIPETVTPGTFNPYSDEAAARKALAAGDISAFYIVPADYLHTGKISFVRPDFNPLSSSGAQSNLFTWVLQVNLVEGDIMFASLVNGPLKVNEISLAAVAAPDEDNTLAFWAPYFITILFYLLIVGSATLLLSNISKEKENRVMEVLLTSATARQLLTGKILGLGIVGFGQTLFWFGTSYVLFNLSGRTFNLPANIHLPASLLVWGFIFFILGYAVYASLMAGLGALAPNLREASQATFIITLPLMVPLLLSSSVFMRAPNGAIAVALSLFPLSAPVAMMARLASGGVTWWQPVVAALLLLGTAMMIVRLVAGMFRAQALLSGQPFKLKTYIRTLAGKN